MRDVFSLWHKANKPLRLALIGLYFCLSPLSVADHVEPQPTPLFSTPLFIENPEILKELEQSGFSFQHWFTSPGQWLANKQLHDVSVGYKSLVHVIKKDLDRIKTQDPLLSVTLAKSHRLFDQRWLWSPYAYYELVGIIYRPDRRVFNPKYCGETRFIYRLAYQKKQHQHWMNSRLPLTWNVVLWNASNIDPQSCQQDANRWQQALAKSQPLNETIKSLTSADGPFPTSSQMKSRIKSIELNMQAVRWPSTMRPDMGGYAEYLLKAFTPKQDKAFAVSTLENTPNISLLEKDKSLRKSLLQWLSQAKQLTALDQGTLVIPEKYLTTEITSVALHGRSRVQNHPFQQLFKEDDFAALSFVNYQSFKTPKALIRRLDDMTCSGCHQGRTVAGFHFLGKDRSQTSPFNFILSAQSPHFLKDQTRRQQYFSDLINKKTPSENRPFSERAEQNDDGYGSHCSLGKDNSFDNWTCATGLTCQGYNSDKHDPIGICLDPLPHDIGGPCRSGNYKAHKNPHKDRITHSKSLACKSGLVCEVPSVGFPGGLCSGSCSNLKEDETCGDVAILFGFNRCLANKKPFDQCLADHTRPGALRRCDAETPCRNDYVCAKTSNSEKLFEKTGVESGACIPPYFLFQLRVDGHPHPIKP